MRNREIHNSSGNFNIPLSVIDRPSRLKVTLVEYYPQQ